MAPSLYNADFCNKIDPLRTSSVHRSTSERAVPGARASRRSWPTRWNADDGDFAVEFLRHGVPLCFGAPRQLGLLAGLEHGWTIPLAEAAWALALAMKIFLGPAVTVLEE